MTTKLECARQLLAVALETAPEGVRDSARLGDPEAWDSLAHLRLILAIEAELGTNSARNKSSRLNVWPMSRRSWMGLKRRKCRLVRRGGQLI